MDQANERHLKKIGKSRESSYCTYCTVLWFHVTRSLCISFCATDTTCSRCYGKLLRSIQPVLKASQHCLSHPNLSCKESYPTNKGPHKFLETRNSFPDVVLTFCKASKHRFPHLLLRWFSHFRHRGHWCCLSGPYARSSYVVLWRWIQGSSCFCCSLMGSGEH